MLRLFVQWPIQYGIWVQWVISGIGTEAVERGMRKERLLMMMVVVVATVVAVVVAVGLILAALFLTQFYNMRYQSTRSEACLSLRGDP